MIIGYQSSVWCPLLLFIFIKCKFVLQSKSFVFGLHSLMTQFSYTHWMTEQYIFIVQFIDSLHAKPAFKQQITNNPTTSLVAWLFSCMSYFIMPHQTYWPSAYLRVLEDSTAVHLYWVVNALPITLSSCVHAPSLSQVQSMMRHPWIVLVYAHAKNAQSDWDLGDLKARLMLWGHLSCFYLHFICNSFGEWCMSSGIKMNARSIQTKPFCF